MLVQVNVKVADRADGSVRWVEVCRFPNLNGLIELLQLWNSVDSGHADFQVRVFNDIGVRTRLSEACRPHNQNQELAG